MILTLTAQYIKSSLRALSRPVQGYKSQLTVKNKHKQQQNTTNSQKLRETKTNNQKSYHSTTREVMFAWSPVKGHKTPLSQHNT